MLQFLLSPYSFLSYQIWFQLHILNEVYNIFIYSYFHLKSHLFIILYVFSSSDIEIRTY